METPNYQQRINLVLRHIEQNLDTRPDLDELARIACFSPYHFHRIFSAMVGESVAAYVRRLLLERAAMQLGYSGCVFVAAPRLPFAIWHVVSAKWAGAVQ